jgi:phosphatidate cytidylyltransferase
MKRILTAMVLIPVIIWTVVWAPTWAFRLVLALVGAGAFHEFDNIAGAHGFRRSGWLGIAGGLIFLLSSFPAAALLTVLAAAFMALQLHEDDFPKTLPSVSATILGIVYIFGAWRCAMLLREYSAVLLMVPLLVSWAGDTAAMYIGKAWGKRKLAPHVSPGKTWEGAIASVIGGALIASLYVYFTHAPMGWLQALLIGAVTNVAGQLGDLSESAFKRGAGIKDSGNMLPGHGGWLDRIDSSLFTIPAFYVAVQLLSGR